MLQSFFLPDFASLHQSGPLLFPCSNLRRETLPSALREAGLGLEALESYVTEPRPDIEENISSLVEGLAPEGDTLCAVFFSPSGISYALDKLVEITGSRGSLKVQCICTGKNLH
jgi:uroporphyrinogen-III synthase